MSTFFEAFLPEFHNAQNEYILRSFIKPLTDWVISFNPFVSRSSKTMNINNKKKEKKKERKKDRKKNI